MSLCPECGKVYCDHTPEERRQTREEMNRPLTAAELEAWKRNHDGGVHVQNIVAAKEVQVEARRKRS